MQRLNIIRDLIHGIKTLKKFKQTVEDNDNRLIIVTFTDGQTISIPISAEGMIIIDNRITLLVDYLKTLVNELNPSGSLGSRIL